MCGLYWSKNCNEIVSTHGYNTNAIKLWKCPELECFATIPGHAMRIVYMSVSPDGKTIVTGAGRIIVLDLSSCRLLGPSRGILMLVSTGG